MNRSQIGETLIKHMHLMMAHREAGPEASWSYKRLEMEVTAGIRALADTDKAAIKKFIDAAKWAR